MSIVRKTDFTLQQMNQLERGFALVCYGCIVVLLLTTGILRVDIISADRWPVFAVGFAMIAAGMFRVFAGMKHTVCSGLVKWCLVGALVLVYFCPFYTWWRQLPFHSFMIVNLLLGVACLITWQALLNIMLSRIAILLDERYLRIQARIGFIAVILFEGVPFVALVTAALPGVIRFHTHIYFELLQQLYRFPWWFLALSVFPITLSVANCWYMRALCKEKMETKLAKNT